MSSDILVASLIVIAIGIVHGAAIARALRSRFPSFKTHAKFVSVALLSLFSINSILALNRFWQPSDEFALSSISAENLPTTLISLIGIDGGLLSTLSISLMAIIFVLTRFTRLEGVLRYFVLAVSAGTILMAIVYRVLGLVPDATQILSYALYHVGFNVGMFFVINKERALGRAVLRGLGSGMRALACKVFEVLRSKFRN